MTDLQPLFISGIGRSGTSALLQAMSEHPSVCKTDRIGEAPFISSFLNFLVQYEDTSANASYHHQNYRLTEEDRLDSFSDFMIQNQCGNNIIRKNPDQIFWIAKTSLGKLAHHKAEEIFDEVRTLYIMRNGIEVIHSARNFPGFAHLNFKQLCQRWSDSFNCCRFLTKTPRSAVIKHHDLVNNPIDTFDYVYSKLQMEYHPAPANFISSTFFNSSFDDSNTDGTTQSKFSSRISAWNQWSNSEQIEFISTCDQYMQEFDFHRPYDNSMTKEATPEKSVVAGQR